MNLYLHLRFLFCIEFMNFYYFNELFYELLVKEHMSLS
jgi:hypothetical protein